MPRKRKIKQKKSKQVDKLNSYNCKSLVISGTSLDELNKKTKAFFKEITKKTRRKPYIRSAYFNKQKIFFDYFWGHLNQKGSRQRIQRLQLFNLAIELIKYSRNAPTSKDNPTNRNEILHRFSGLTKSKKRFFVQIKEDKKKNHKYFMSTFWGKG